VPPLWPNLELEPTAFSHVEKTEALRQRFFAEAEAILDDIQDRTFNNGALGQATEMDRNNAGQERGSARAGWYLNRATIQDPGKAVP
jgi:hypothetical protein